MKVIKQLGSKCQDIGEAQDCLAGTAVVPGFVFGYVDEQECRAVTFHEFTESGGICSGQQLVQLTVGGDAARWQKLRAAIYHLGRLPTKFDRLISVTAGSTHAGLDEAVDEMADYRPAGQHRVTQ